MIMIMMHAHACMRIMIMKIIMIICMMTRAPPRAIMINHDHALAHDHVIGRERAIATSKSTKRRAAPRGARLCARIRLRFLFLARAAAAGARGYGALRSGIVVT